MCFEVNKEVSFAYLVLSGRIMDCSLCGWMFMVAPYINSVKYFIVQTSALNYMNCRVIKTHLKCKNFSGMFRFTQEPSSGSQSQCLAKITGLVPLCLSVCVLPVLWRHMPPRICNFS